MMVIKNYTNWGGSIGAGGIYLFDIFLYYFINVIIKNIIYQQFLLLFTLYMSHIVHIDVFFPSPEKLTFGCKNVSSNTVFDPDG